MSEEIPPRSSSHEATSSTRLSAHFADASREALRFLRERLGFHLSMVTRVDRDDWILLSVEDTSYGVTEGSVLRWGDSFCSRMVCGRGPRLAPRSEDVPAYRDAPIARQLPIRAYAGAPIVCSDGQLFGTLCAVSPHERPELARGDEALVSFTAGLLGRVLDAERERDAEAHRADAAEAQSSLDGVAGVHHRRAWQEALDREDARARRYGHSSSVICVRLERLSQIKERHGYEAGDELVRESADILRSVVRESDLVARVSGDQFGLLVHQTVGPELGAFTARVAQALGDAGIRAGIGAAAMTAGPLRTHAWLEAVAATREAPVSDHALRATAIHELDRSRGAVVLKPRVGM